MRLMVLSVAMLATVGAASAEKDNDTYDLMACIAQPGEAATAACVDSVKAGADPFDRIPTGRWRIMSINDKVDNSKMVIVSLYAIEGDNSLGDRVQFNARCMFDSTKADISWGVYLGNDSNSSRSGWKNVTISIGDAEGRTERWGLSADSKDTLTPGWAGNFIREITTADRLVVRTTPHRGSPITAIFDTRGAKEAFKELSEACGWSIDGPSKKK